jgi:cholesterol oxidase
LTPPTGTGLPPVSAPVGVTFKEELSGYLAEVAAPAIGDDDAYEAAEIAGRPKISVSLKLKASIADISQFLHNDARTAQLSGTARVVTPNLVGDFDVWGVLRLFPEGDDPASGRMEYNLHLLPQRAPGEDPQRPRQEVATLDGYKRVHDDPGPDVWRDTTTLFVTLTPQGPPKTPCHGALHMAMNRFLAAELPSFEVLGTADPARVLWALAAFNAYFFRSVQRVYVPQLNKVFNLVDDIGLR